MCLRGAGVSIRSLTESWFCVSYFVPCLLQLTRLRRPFYQLPLFFESHISVPVKKIFPQNQVHTGPYSGMIPKKNTRKYKLKLQR